MNKVSNREILSEARRLIQDIGFCKGRSRYVDADGHALAYCPMGAIDAAVERLYPNEPDNYRITLACNDVFRDANEEIVSIPNWSDDPLRTKSDVLSAFSRAISSCEE